MINNPLVNITDKAANRAKDLLSKNENVVGLRVSVSQGGCSGMTYNVSFSEKIKKEMKSLEKNGINFIIDPSAVMFLIGSTIDWKEEKFKKGFTFENPNETARCGCGESFTTS